MTFFSTEALIPYGMQPAQVLLCILIKPCMCCTSLSLLECNEVNFNWFQSYKGAGLGDLVLVQHEECNAQVTKVNL